MAAIRESGLARLERFALGETRPVYGVGVGAFIDAQETARLVALPDSDFVAAVREAVAGFDDESAHYVALAELETAGVCFDRAPGGFRLSTVHGARRVSRLFIGYTLPEVAAGFIANPEGDS